MGMNVIRLPFWYRNFQNEDGSAVTSPFAKMDWLVTNAWARGIYTILDFHVEEESGGESCEGGGRLKYDQDKSFGAANLRMAFNQVRVLELAGYAKTGRFVGLDVKAMRTQKPEVATRHLSNSRRIFLALVEKVRTFDKKIEQQCIQNRDYEALDLAIMEHLMGIKSHD